MVVQPFKPFLLCNFSSELYREFNRALNVAYTYMSSLLSSMSIALRSGRPFTSNMSRTSLFLSFGIWFGLTKSHLQTRLFISMSTRHLVDLLTARGDILLVVLGTSGSNNSKTTTTDLSRTSAGVLWCYNATLLAGSANMTMTIVTVHVQYILMIDVLFVNGVYVCTLRYWYFR